MTEPNASGTVTASAEWHYIGHFGQLGPLTFQQIKELAQDGVIERNTQVWRQGMSQWLPAGAVNDLHDFFPDPIPMMHPPTHPASGASAYRPYQSAISPMPYPLQAVMSDRSIVLAGILQILLPGVGRIYLGYTALGVIQLLLWLACGIGWIWGIIDGVIMLAGRVQYDGYGRLLRN